jgi:hypothetical protein
MQPLFATGTAMADSKKMPLPFPVEAKAAFRRLSQGSTTDSYGDCGARVKSPKDTYLRTQGFGRPGTPNPTHRLDVTQRGLLRLTQAA